MKSTIATILFLFSLTFAAEQASQAYSTALSPRGVAQVPASSIALSTFLPIFNGFQIGQLEPEHDPCSKWAADPWAKRVEGCPYEECPQTINLQL